MPRRVTQAFALLLLATHCLAQDPANSNTPPKKAKPPTGTITGTVFCADTNLPARGAEIFLVQISKGDPGIQSGGTTDLDGRFVIHHVPGGSVFVVAQLPGYLNPIADLTRSDLQSMKEEERKALESRLTSVTVSAGQTADASLRLERAGEIDGTVQYDDGSPAIGLRVVLKSAKEAADTLASSLLQAVSMTNEIQRQTDDRGHFRILGVTPGQYLVAIVVRANSSDDPSSSNPFVRSIQNSDYGSLMVYAGNTTRATKAKVIKIETTSTSQDVDITIPLSKLHTVRGHVVIKSTNQPPPGASLQLLYSDTHEMARAVIAPDSEFEIHYVPEDNYLLEASASPEAVPTFDLNDGDDSLGAIVSGSSATSFVFSSSPGTTESAGKMNNSADVPLAVTGDVDNVVVAVPDPHRSQPEPDPSAESPGVETAPASGPQ